MSALQALLLTSGLALASVKLVTFPLLDAFQVGLYRLWPAQLRVYYDPLQDVTASIMYASALSGYVVVAMGLCTVLDCVPSLTMAHKTQAHRSFFTVGQWCSATGVGLVNLLCFSWFATVPVWSVVQKDGALRGGTPLMAFDTPFNPALALVHFVVHVLVIDVWFYLTHRLIHFPVLYKWIHKFHHRFKAPCAVACVYANPIEFLVGNVGGVVLGPALTNCHPYSAAFWMAYALISTSLSHSGYVAFGAQGHDAHHEHFDYNYGVGVFMDKLLGTTYEGSARAKLVAANRQDQPVKTHGSRAHGD